MTFTGVQGIISQVIELPTATIVGVSDKTMLLEPFSRKSQFCAWRGRGANFGVKIFMFTAHQPDR
jgi:hypothetical protein